MPRLHPSLALRTNRGWNLDPGILARAPAPPLPGPQDQSGMKYGHRYFGSFPGSTPSWPSGPVGDGIWTPAHRTYNMGSAAIGGRVRAEGDRWGSLETNGGQHRVRTTNVFNLKFSILFYSKYYSTECEIKQHTVRTILVMRRGMLLTGANMATKTYVSYIVFSLEKLSQSAKCASTECE